MLIYANYQNLGMVDANFLPPKKRKVKVRQSQGRAAANNFAFSRYCAKTDFRVHRDPTLTT